MVCILICLSKISLKNLFASAEGDCNYFSLSQMQKVLSFFKRMFFFTYSLWRTATHPSVPRFKDKPSSGLSFWAPLSRINHSHFWVLTAFAFLKIPCQWVCALYISWSFLSWIICLDISFSYQVYLCILSISYSALCIMVYHENLGYRRKAGYWKAIKYILISHRLKDNVVISIENFKCLWHK